MPHRKSAPDLAGPNDIVHLANHLDGLDPACYFDRQTEDAWRHAARRWPKLAAILGLDAGRGRRSSPD